MAEQIITKECFKQRIVNCVKVVRSVKTAERYLPMRYNGFFKTMSETSERSFDRLGSFTCQTAEVEPHESAVLLQRMHRQK